MPNKHAAIKELRKSTKRQAQHARIKTNVKQKLKLVQEHIKNGNVEEAKKAASLFQKAADKAAKKNIISKNRASRKKSTLMKALVSKT